MAIAACKLMLAFQTVRSVPDMWLIEVVGEYFHIPQDQSEILRILEKTQKDHARPTERVRQKMFTLWGLAPSMTNTPLAAQPQNNSTAQENLPIQALDLSISDNEALG